MFWGKFTVPVLASILILGAFTVDYSIDDAFAKGDGGTDHAGAPSVADPSDIISLDTFSTAAVDLDLNFGRNEPHIAVNPTDPTNVVAANFGGGLQISTDSGASFPTQSTRPTPASLAGLGYSNSGDDVITFDSQGQLFWTYLLSSPNDLTVVVAQVNPITGAIISSIDVTPGNFSDDKPWIAADANLLNVVSADNLYITWVRFDQANDGPTGLEEFVLFSRSLDSNVTWSAPAAVSTTPEWFAWPPHIAVAQNGDVYLNYKANACSGNGSTGTIQVHRDTTDGLSLQNSVAVQKTAAFGAGGADITCNRIGVTAQIPGSISWMQGAGAAYTLPDPTVPGKIHVVSNDDPNNDFTTGDSSNVVMATSLDNGLTWPTTVTISDDQTGAFQVMPIAAIDEFGNIAVTWYDNRNGATNAAMNFMLDLYGSTSIDGGATFAANFQVNDVNFDPDLNAPARFTNPATTLRIGEYNGIAAINCLAHADWTGNDATTPFGQEVFYDNFAIPGGCSGEINGFKYEDIDGDGIFNGADVTIQGWEICIFNDGDESDPADAIECKDTDVNGEVLFDGLIFGDYVACEEVQTDWTNVSDICQDVTTDINNKDPTVNFGNWKDVTIMGEKWEDTDGDDVDNAEPRLDGWEIKLTQGIKELTTTTADGLGVDPLGKYTFGPLGPEWAGSAQICETVQPDWTRTHPNNNCIDITIQSGGDLGASLPDDDTDFGNWKDVTIMGEKWEDTDADGIDNANAEPRLADWEIKLIHGVAVLELTRTTADGLGADPLGKYTFGPLGPEWAGSAQICETVQPGWIPSHPGSNCIDITIESGGDLGATLPDDDTDFGNLLAIEAEKTWTHTDYNWGPICTLVNPDPPFNCLVDRPRETDIPSDEVLAEPLDTIADKYILNAKAVKNKIKAVTPGAFYALTTIEIKADLDSLTVDENYEDCYDNQDLIKFVSKNKVSRNVKVAVSDSDGVVTELSDDIYDDIGGTIVDIDHIHAEIEITDPDHLKAGNTLYVLVKFNHDLKNESAPGNVFDEMCDNTEEVTAALLGQDASVTAEASLRITTG